MAMCFRGAAFANFKYITDQQPHISYADLCASMKSRFGCKLSQAQLSKLLETPKMTSLTWTSHVEYMRAVANRMDGNSDKVVQEYFCSYTCPSEERNLLAKINQESTQHGIELDRAVRYLTSITGIGKDFECKLRSPLRADRDVEMNKKRDDNKNERAEAHTAGGVRPKRACFFCDQ